MLPYFHLLRKAGSPGARTWKSNVFFPHFDSMAVVACINTEQQDPDVLLGQLKKFAFQELQIATDNFNIKNILGKGGFGNVYKGYLCDGSLVAVKRLKGKGSPGAEIQFQMEVEMISLAVHRNLLRLRGFCMTPRERLLVYPYMPNGSVASRLRGEMITIFF